MPNNLFVKRDLNSTVDKHGPISAELEMWYSQLEGAIKPLTDKIINEARRGRRPLLSVAERDLWDLFFYHQQKRAPDIYDRLGVGDEFEQLLPQHLAEYEKRHGPLSDARRTEVLSPDARARIKQNASVRARSMLNSEVRDALAMRGIAIGIAPRRRSFVLGDYPTSRRGPSSNITHPDAELWLPIAPDVAISPWGPPRSEYLAHIHGDHVRSVNMAILENSNVIAGPACQLITSLASRIDH